MSSIANNKNLLKKIPKINFKKVEEYLKIKENLKHKNYFK